MAKHEKVNIYCDGCHDFLSVATWLLDPEMGLSRSGICLLRCCGRHSSPDAPDRSEEEEQGEIAGDCHDLSTQHDAKRLRVSL